MTIKFQRKNGKKPKRTRGDNRDAVTSAVGNMAARFLQENKDKGRPLRIPSLNVILYPDGKEEKISDQE